MNTQELWEYAFDVWYHNIAHGYLVFITDIERTGEYMAYLAADMILRGDY